MFCGYQPSNLSTPDNIEEVKQKWKKENLTNVIFNNQLMNKLTLLSKFRLNIPNLNLRK